MKFRNPYVQEHFETRDGQADTKIIIPRLKWRSNLSQITNRVAEHMIANGSNLVRRKHTHTHTG